MLLQLTTSSMHTLPHVTQLQQQHITNSQLCLIYLLATVVLGQQRCCEQTLIKQHCQNWLLLCQSKRNLYWTQEYDQSFLMIELFVVALPELLTCVERRDHNLLHHSKLPLLLASQLIALVKVVNVHFLDMHQKPLSNMLQVELNMIAYLIIQWYTIKQTCMPMPFK